MISNADSNLVIAATGSAWTGKGIRSIWSIVRDSFSEAHREVVMAAYSLSESPDFYKVLDDCLVRGISIVLIVNRLSNQPEGVKNSLYQLIDRYENFILKDFTPHDARNDLHAKIIVIDHKVALVGSANPTWKGMIMNHEIMVKITGKQASEIGQLVDKLAVYHETKSVSSGLRK